MGGGVGGRAAGPRRGRHYGAAVTRGGGSGGCSPPAPSHYADEAAVIPLARGLHARAGM